MATVKITNGFNDNHCVSPTGIQLAGVVTEGTIAAGDMLLLENGSKVPINAVEPIPFEDPQGMHVALSVNHPDVSWRLFNKTFETVGK